MNEEKSNEKNIQKKKWNHILYEHGDLSKIGLFFKELFSGIGDYGNMGFFNWKIVDNYIQPGIINLIKDGNRIASITSVTPKLLIYKGKVINAAEIGDTYTHPEYLRQGMFSLLINQTREDAESKDINFVYGTPNELSLPGYQKKANFDIIKNLHVRSLIFPVNIKPNIQKRSHWIPGSIISSIVSIFSFLYFKIKNIFFFLDKTLVVEEINQVPRDWDDFWNQAKQEFEFIINRDAKAMVWRYLDNPNKYKLILLRKNKTLIGYMVFRLISDDIYKNIMVADYLTLPGEENAIYVGINYIINYAFKIGVNQVGLWCVDDGSYFKLLKKKGFFARGNVPVICYQNEFAKEINNCTSWHFTIGDSDNI
ncbi:MAG: hypothetical protein CMG74_04185 [Candidatus Marinimicrobia bacterium]|nr:hypothetical protein [Candidatus Neomarinimicrobiota bacterium]